MVFHLSSPPRVSPRSMFKTLMRRIFLVSSRGRLARLLHRLLLLTIAGVLLVLLRLLASTWTAGHIQCECGRNVSTGEREARYLMQIMQEADPSNNKTTLQSLQEEHPSLAIQFLLEEELRGWRCDLVPGLFTIRHNNALWQQARVRAHTFLLFSAHWDDRDGEAMIRILSVADGEWPHTPWCLLHARGGAPPVATRAERVDFLHWQYPQEGFWQPFLISCSAGTARPAAVSVGEAPCLLPTNALIISGSPNDPKSLGPQLMRALDRNSESVNWDSPANLREDGSSQLSELQKQNLKPRQEKEHSLETLNVNLKQENGAPIETKLKTGNSPVSSWKEGAIQGESKHGLGSKHGSGAGSDGQMLFKEIENSGKVLQNKASLKAKFINGIKGNNKLQQPFESKIAEVEAKNKSQTFEKYRKNASHKLNQRKNLALCHKFLFNEKEDNSLRLIEWLEAARAWGVDDVTLYVHSVHSNVMRVLRRYEQQGLVTVIPWTNPGHYPNSPALQRALYDTQRYVLFTLENIPYTDCLLRHVNTHRYVAVWDIDEFLLPVTPYSSLPELLDSAKLKWFKSHSDKCLKYFYDDQNFGPAQLNALLENSLDSAGILQVIDQPKKEAFPPECLPPVSYLAQCSYFFDDLLEPPDNSTAGLHMLSHVTRTFKVTKPRVFTKAVHDTTRALGLHAHFALYSSAGPVDRQRELYDLYPSDEGFLAHYRSKCQGESQQECEEEFRPHLQRDESMWLHKRQISERAAASISALGLKP